MACNAYGQQKIAHLQPDALGPGMTIAMEILAPAKDTGAFGADGMYWSSAKIQLVNSSDSSRVIFGPASVSWNGRVLQVPVMAAPNASPGNITFRVIIGNKQSAVATFQIVTPIPLLNISDTTEIGDVTASYSFAGAGSTIVASGAEISGSGVLNNTRITFSKRDIDTIAPGNPHYHPVVILVRGRVHLRFSEISVSADSLNGGPGGGGGGHGWAGTGGAGYTGGGSDSGYFIGNQGSGANPTNAFGGVSSTGITGGASVDSLSDQGGGGGTGCPYGSSGIFSAGNDSSQTGGFGGASAGGETTGLPYGGGGGAFGAKGLAGGGKGNNGGHPYGGRYLVPMQGGSGGGGGNHVSDKDSTAGSGGGGGGALTIISYDSIVMDNSYLYAEGANGTSGTTSVDAGGGGGSGGGILLSARNGISLSNSEISTLGGTGGLGGSGIDSISKGGDAGFGRIRIDGDVQQSQLNIFHGIQISGPTLDIPSTQLLPPFIQVSGMAGDSSALTDSIRIYYRNHHSSWRYLDTIRFKDSPGKFRWQATLPAGHDSELFVTVAAQTRNPARSFANFEPSRLLSHLSSGIIPLHPTPHLVLEYDTLDFGCYKVDTCVSANFYISNQGEDSLRISSIAISNSNFQVTRPVSRMGYYASDSITIQYCPNKFGNDTATITILSNDTVRTSVLIGCGINKDSRIVLKPNSLNFKRVPVGKCDTLHLVAYSIGKDSAVIDPNGFSHPPFSITSPLTAKNLAPNDSVGITIAFCPSDSGSFRSSFIFTQKRDSVKLTGIGTRKIFRSQPDIVVGKLCLGSCDSVKIKLFSSGNDTVHLNSIAGASFSEQLPFALPPQTDTDFTIHYCPLVAGDSSIVIHLISDADTMQTVLHYHAVHPEFSFDSALHFAPHCAFFEDSLPVQIRRTGIDSITISSAHLVHGAPFLLAGDTAKKIDQAHLVVHFIPTTTGLFLDTLSVKIATGICSDSTLKIPITGSGTNSDLIFSKTRVAFGGIDTNVCAVDTIIVSNPCHDNAMLSIPPVALPFAIISPTANTLTVAGGDSAFIIYRYCPRVVGHDSVSQKFSLASGATVTISVVGSGLPVIDSPLVRFKLPTVSVNAGSEFFYPIIIDTLSQTAKIFSVQGSLHYDPTVVEPVGMISSQWTINKKAERTPGTYDFSASGQSALTIGETLGSVEMLALYGVRDTTSVFLNNIGDSNYAKASVIGGNIQIVACSNLPGNIIVPGSYTLGNPSPNPSNGNLLLPVSIGTDGTLHIRIYSESGANALERTYELKRGEHTLALDVSTLPSGIYYLATDSWGWRDGKTFVIQK
jgi:hypothetical protein